MGNVAAYRYMSLQRDLSIFTLLCIFPLSFSRLTNSLLMLTLLFNVDKKLFTESNALAIFYQKTLYIMPTSVCRRLVPPAFFDIRIVKLATGLVGCLCFGARIDDLPFHLGSGQAWRPKDFIVNLAFLRNNPVVRRDALAFSIRVGNIGDHNHPRPLTCHRPWRGFAVRYGKCGRCRKICRREGKLVSAAYWEPITEYLPPSRVLRAFLANQGECGMNCAKNASKSSLWYLSARLFAVNEGSITCGLIPSERRLS